MTSFVIQSGFSLSEIVLFWKWVPLCHYLDSSYWWSYISLILSDLLPLVWSWLGPFILLQMTSFYAFWWLSNIPFNMCTIPFSSLNEYSGFSTFWLLVTLLQWRLGCVCLSQLQFNPDARPSVAFQITDLHLQVFKEPPYWSPVGCQQFPFPASA